MKAAAIIILTLFFFSDEQLFAQNKSTGVIHLSGDELPTLTFFKPVKNLSGGSAVIVCSGGAYAFRSDEGEGSPTCKKLQEAGIAAFLLDYRLPTDTTLRNKSFTPLMDAQLAVQWIREHARKYNIDPDRIGILGYSAGGHLAATAATHFDSDYIENSRKTNLRPDFVVLVYPVISFFDSLTNAWSRSNLIGPDITMEKIREFSDELHITDHTPPVFLAHAMDDEGVKVQNSLYFYSALLQHHIPCFLFLYAEGGHAFDFHNRTASVQWIDACMEWIKKGKWKKF